LIKVSPQTTLASVGTNLLAFFIALFNKSVLIFNTLAVSAINLGLIAHNHTKIFGFNNHILAAHIQAHQNTFISHQGITSDI